MTPAGSGPSVEFVQMSMSVPGCSLTRDNRELEKGRFKVVNVTRLGGADSRPVDARTEIAFSVDSGYLGTSGESI